MCWAIDLPNGFQEVTDISSSLSESTDEVESSNGLAESRSSSGDDFFES